MQVARHNLILPRISGVLMLGIFTLNAYIGLKDTVLFKLQPTHQGLNFMIAAVDLVASSFLIYYSAGRRNWVLLAGVIWPVVYLFSLLADVESKMCLFSGQHCFTSVQVSYQYLILGRLSAGWLLWPYTMMSVILLLTLVVLFSAIHFVKHK